MPDASDVAALAASAVALGALAIIGVLALVSRPRRPDAGPPTPDLPDDLPPALANLVTEGFEPTREALAATLIDLAARRHLSIDQHVDGTVVLGLRTPARPDPLLPFEQHLLHRLRAVAHDRVVPAGALGFATEAEADRWWKGARREIVHEARRRGLCRRRWPIWLNGVTTAALATCAVLLLGVDDEGATTLAEGVGFGAAAALLAVSALVLRSDRQRETETGRAVGGRWLGLRRYLADAGSFTDLPPAAVALWDRYLAYAAAFGLAPVTVDGLPLGEEDARRAWSTVTGSWRRVTVGYPRFVPGWGRHPVRAIVATVVRSAVVVTAAVVVGLVLDAPGLLDPGDDEATGRWLVLAVTVAVVGVVGYVALQVWILVQAVVDLFGHRAVEGVVVRRRRRLCPTPDRTGWASGWQGATDADPYRKRDRCFLAVDDGSSADIRAFAVRRELWEGVQQGEAVRVEVTPFLRWVRALRAVGSAPAVGTTTAAPAVDGHGPSPPSALVDRAAALARLHADGDPTSGPVTD